MEVDYWTLSWTDYTWLNKEMLKRHVSKKDASLGNWAKIHKTTQWLQVVFVRVRKCNSTNYMKFDLAVTLTCRPSQLSSSVVTSSTKVWWNFVHWFARYRANRTHAQTNARTHGRTTRKHNASDTSIGGRDGNGSSFVTHDPYDTSHCWPMTHMTHDPWPMAITSFHPTHGTRRGRGMVVLDNPLGLESKKL